MQISGHADRRVSKTPEQWTSLASGDLLAADSALRTSAGAVVLLSIPGNHVVRIGENSTLELKTLGQASGDTFSLIKGQLWSFVDKATKPAKYEVETPSTILGVSGTLFSVAIDPNDNESDVSVLDGTVHLRQGRMDKAVGPGLQMRVLPNRLRFAIARPHTKATAAMWKAIQERETWHKPNGGFGLNRQVDEAARALRQERVGEKAAGRGAATRGGGARGRGR